MRVTGVALIMVLGGCAAGTGDGIDAPDTLRLTSPAFAAGGPIPDLYTCDGPDIPPPLDVTDIATDVPAVALVMDDPGTSRGTFTHWLVWDVPASGGVAHFPEGRAPPGGVEGTNSRDLERYAGPCPPAGDGPHHYAFTAYALDARLGLAAGADRDALFGAMRDHVVAKGSLGATYDRP